MMSCNKTTDSQIKGILLDYGGTIDTNGLHWVQVLNRAYIASGIEIQDKLFRDAFIHGERTLALHPVIQPDFTFLRLLEEKIRIQLSFLAMHGYKFDDEKEKIIKISLWCDHFVRQTIDKTKTVLDNLSRQFPLVLVSNFYGNLHTVTETYQIRHYFKNIVESAVAGVRKPDPEIFNLGVQHLGVMAKECLVIGDSLTKDITPAKTAGCRTVWLKGTGWDETGNTGDADYTITGLCELTGLINQWNQTDLSE